MLDELGSREGFREYVSRHARSWALEESNNAVLDLFLEQVDSEVDVLMTYGGKVLVHIMKFAHYSMSYVFVLEDSPRQIHLSSKV